VDGFETAWSPFEDMSINWVAAAPKSERATQISTTIGIEIIKRMDTQRV